MSSVTCWEGAEGLIVSLHTFLTGQSHPSHRQVFIPAARQTSSCNRAPMSSAFIFNNVRAGMLLVTALLAERLHAMRELNASEWDDK